MNSQCRKGISEFGLTKYHQSLHYSMSTSLNIPITVFTGFLGAGKTSIILSLLPQLPKDSRIVLLKNEFGDVEGEFLSIVVPLATLTRSSSG